MGTPFTPLPSDDAPTIIGTAGTGAGSSRPVTGPLEPGAPFGPRYRILRVLGAGSMGVVYQAWDEELSVAVALKVIRPEVTGDPYAAQEVERRFKRELLLARQVTHRHVVRIHDLGEIDGIKYLTMPFVDGRDLSAILRETGPMPVSRALRLGRQIATGLLAAHEAGVVHRDLKPENIMIDADDCALIMDFGISRSVSGTGAGTAMGTVMGTLEYMAPEQGRGVQVDQRADIYSFGLMLHDMIAGRTRLAGTESGVGEMMSRMQQAPAALRTIVPHVPEGLERIVSRCLQPDPALRYQTTGELLADLDALDADGRSAVAPAPPKKGRLKWAGIAAAVVLLVIGTAAALRLGRETEIPGASTGAARPAVSILIADFQNSTGDSVFQGSLEQALAIAMEGAPFVSSYSRSSAQALGAQIANGKTLTEAVARLVAVREGVKVVLAGAISGAGDGYELTLRAISPADGQNVAAVTASADSKAEVLGAVAELASDMREQLGDTKADAGAESLTASTLEAVQNYSIAQDFAARGRQEEAIGYYQTAITHDPQFGRAYSGLATSNFYLGRRDEAQKNWDEALKYMDRMTEREKYRTRGTYFLAVTQDYDKAIDEYSTLVKLYPADRAGHNNLAFAYFAMLNFPKALEEGRRAVELAPTHVTIRNNYALYAMYAGDFQTAAREAEEVIKLDAAFHKAYLIQAISALANGDEARARQAYEVMAKTDAVGASVANLGLADIEMSRGRWAEAERLLRTGLEADRSANNQDSIEAKSVALAETRLGQGDATGAKAAAAEALKAGNSDRVVVPAAQLFASLGDDASARRLASGLNGQLQRQPRAYGSIIEGDVALAQRKLPQAVDAYRKAIETADLWLAHFRLGLAYLEAGKFVEALSEFELCEKRRGEATSLFLDDLPTFRYLAPLSYWKARAEDGRGRASNAKAGYETFLQLRPGATDALTRDAQARLARLK